MRRIEVAGSRSKEELERRPDQFPRVDVAAAEAGGISGRHGDLVAGARGCLDVEGAIGLAGDSHRRHAVTLLSLTARHDGWPAVTCMAADAPLPVGGRFYSEDRHKPAAYILDASGDPWIDLP